MFHDGGLLLSFPDRVVGVFLAFQSQCNATDAAGNAVPGARPLSQVQFGHPHQPSPMEVTSAVYLERALINPAGSDPGRETVVLGNCATTTQSVHGWRLTDRNGRATKLDADVPAGASLIVPLDGTGIQLGNNGGNLLLHNESALQVDSVTYSAVEAAAVDRYVASPGETPHRTKRDVNSRRLPGRQHRHGDVSQVGRPNGRHRSRAMRCWTDPYQLGGSGSSAITCFTYRLTTV